jgi:2-dehydropantoate 2-reductase
VFGKAGIRPAALALGEEAAAVGRAEGAELPEGFVADLLDRFASTPLSFGTSMLYDRRAGRPLEHDAITGAVVRAGRRHGIATPVTEAVDALLGCCGHL